MKSIKKENRGLYVNTCLNQLGLGIALTVIGSVLPMISAEYQLDYQISGILLSVQSAGFLLMGAVVGYLPSRLGVRQTYVFLGALVFLGLIVTMVTSNPILLILAMLMTGFGKGGDSNFTSQFVSNLSHGNTGSLNFMQAFFAVGACVAPLIVMVCGTSWRSALMIVIAFGAVQTIHAIAVPIGSDAYIEKEKVRPDYGFLKEELFWICALLMSTYVAFEASIMGWLVTFFVDTGIVSESTAQILATSLWIALFAGRMLTARISRHFLPYQMIPVMVIGTAICFTMLLFGHHMIFVEIGTIGTGLFMAGLYGTAMGNSGTLMKRYPLCMGMFIVLPGAVSIAVLALIGALAQKFDIHIGMGALYILVFLMILLAVRNVMYCRSKQYHTSKCIEEAEI